MNDSIATCLRNFQPSDFLSRRMDQSRFSASVESRRSARERASVFLGIKCGGARSAIDGQSHVCPGDVKLRSIAEPSPNLSRELTGEGSTKNSGAGIAPSPLPSPHPPPHHIVGREFSSRLVLGGSRRTVHPHTVRGLAESLAAADGKIRVRTHLILPVSRKPPPPHSPGPLRLLHYEHPLVVPQFMHL